MAAAAARKLQKEIDSVLKKVDEGITESEDCWEQAMAAGSKEQKERIGEDLKKSINKLQRLRVQMREWCGQSSVPASSKDKMAEPTKTVEKLMARFKEFERDLKTKAFSKCALARGEELDGDEAEKMKYQDWLTTTIETLNNQVDSFEADLEVFENKKSLSSSDKERSAQLGECKERHKWHIKKLEQILRGIDNDSIDLGELAEIRDSVDYYVESHEDPDYYHDEALYECFDLVEYEEKVHRPSTLDEAKMDAACSTPVSVKEDPKAKIKEKEKPKKAKEDKNTKKKEEKTKVVETIKPNIGGLSAKSGSSSPLVEATPKAVSLLDQLDLDEVKVQEDQLLSEAEEFICKICQIHVVGCCPKLTSCSHLFCGDCIAQWFAQHPESQTWAQRAKSAGPERVVPCPVCKNPLNEKKDMYPVCGITSRSENLLLWRMLSSLKIMCVNHPKISPTGKCEWVGEYGCYQKHIKSCQNEKGVTGDASPCPEAAPAPTLPAAVVSSKAEAESQPTSTVATPAATPAANSHNHQAVASPVSTPSLPQQAAVETSVPVSEARSPSASTPANQSSQGRPAASTPVASETSRSSVHGYATHEQAAAKQAVPEARSPTAECSRSVSTPVAAPQSPAPTVSRRAEDSEAAEDSKRESQSQQAASCAPGKETTPKFVTAGSGFEPTGPAMVKVTAGDRIQVMEQHSSGWTYCKNLSLHGANNTGWVPSWISQVAATPAAPATPAAKPAAPVALPVGAVQTQQPQQQQPQQQQPAKPKAAEASPAVAAPAASPVVNGRSSPVAAQKSPQAAAAPAPAPQPAAEAHNFIRACATFSGAASSQLTLAPSDLVEIVERHSTGWTYGRKVNESGVASAEGWFPDWVVAQQKC